MMYSKFSDQHLLGLLKEGDEAAFTEIYDRYWKVMYLHVFRMLRDEEEAKDVIQELFSTFWLKKETIQSTNISGYLYVAARNKVLNLVQQNKVRSDYLTSLGSFSHEMSNVTLDQLDEKDLANALEREIAKLPDKMRIIFELSRKENLSHKEIALKLGLSDKTVKKQISNALKLIRSNLGVAGASILWLIFLR
ncbi:RNA polymerase sigma 70 [Pedobacter lusitanus]|uniref:RNA polymerase sigma 70 n=1 Tax=Pedobacter lusitanus TaxID=1503925 RepID=A0A0D0EYZ5_9SPHI|nr:RNA polymerase sigma-70 factor [Pedobacter lusitanus]KIO74608.1 RNA polymerase sigma 70 [Pedobacter lusitanus]